MRLPVVVLAAVLVVAGPGQGAADDRQQPLGHQPTAWQSEAFAPHRKAAMRFGDAYRRFLGQHRTEREVVAAALRRARRAGFRELFAGERPPVRAGARLHAVRHGKLAAFVVVGRRPVSEGLRLVAAHVDAVRIDLKQTPVYADGNLALLQTHYYGGLKGYQWLSQPLELRGVVVTRDGRQVEVAIGDEPDEPVLVIPDVSAHMSRHVDDIEGEEVPGESLDPIVSSTPARGGAGDPFAAEAERLIERELGIDIGDLAAAELELVPAAAPRDVGLDRALVGGYGQDDRALGYAALRALFELRRPERTAVVILADKEEIGSTGNTGARSRFLRRLVSELLEGQGVRSSEAAVDDALARSMVLSADVFDAVNPHYRELHDRKNAPYVGGGVVWDQSGVHARVLGQVKRLLDGAGITHQPAAWSKAWGSRSEEGTVLVYFTQQGMDGIELGIPLLSMHSTFELISKADLYEAYRAYRAFLSE